MGAEQGAVPAERQAFFEGERDLLVSQLEERIQPGLELAEHVYLIPGGNRITGSLGGAVTLGLAMKGATVITPHIHDTPELSCQTRLLQETAESYGGSVVVLTADMTDSDERASLYAHVEETYGKLDGVLFMPAGGFRGTDEEADQLNVEAPVATARTFAPLMPKGSFVATSPSIFSHALSLEPPIERYNRTATTKHRGDYALDDLEGELAERGISRISFVGNAYPDTNAMKLMARRLKRRDQETPDEIERSGWTNGEPRLPIRADLAKAVVDTAVAGNYRPGQKEFVGMRGLDRPDVAAALPIYGPDKLLPDDVIFMDEHRAIARMRLTPERERSPVSEDEIELDASDTGHFVVTEDHVRGHFEGPKNPQVFRGVDQIAAAIMAARAGMQKYGVANPMLSELTGIEFKWPIPPGVSVDIHFVAVKVNVGIEGLVKLLGDDSERVQQTAQEALESGARTARIELRSAEHELMTVEHGKMIAAHEHDLLKEGTIASHHNLTQGIELAAQTLGIVGLQQAGVSTEDKLPLFSGIESVKLHKYAVLGQEGQLEADVTLREGSEGVFAGDATLYVDGNAFAQINGISGMLRDAEKVRRIIAKRTAKLLRTDS